MNKICHYILHWIEKNLYEKTNIDELVKITGYSRRTLESNFCRYYRTSIGAYIHQRRMARAALTLKLTKLSVNDVASLFNYSSDSNFTRAFHDFFKKTPTEYRKEEKWDINKLQYPLYIEEMDINSKTVILNTPVFIQGERIHYNAEYKNVSDCSFINKLKSKINKELMDGSGEIWLSSAMNTKKTYEAREGYIGVDIILESTGKTGTSIMKPGTYSTLRFTGNWNEYSLFSRIAYIKYLSSENKLYVDTSCYIKFRRTIEQSSVDCEFFIEISNVQPKKI
ncbi:helix-turn-helix transcriptional regulator [Salmonella enterica subsp. enterica serovar Javiana]|nr:helix-turn-helix transcriptional regulator [Salmonella enterica subsp. enterica serovar Javiana]